jgi:hypothetical protein
MASQVMDRTAFAPRDKRKRERDIDSVYALVLHQTGFSRGNDHTRYDNVTAHFVILPNGTITQNHPETSYLYSSNGLNRGSVAVEFVGNFPSTRGRYYKPNQFGRDHLTQDQIDAGLYLVGYLVKEINLTHILAHCQSSGSRGNCPGPDVWWNVGQRSIQILGPRDGGPDFSVGSGRPIPEAWRTWGD